MSESDHVLDFHRLSNEIHSNGKQAADHWDELIVKYLRAELVEPLAVQLQILGETINRLSTAVNDLQIAIESHKETPRSIQSCGDLLSTKELAAVLHIHPRTVWNMVHDRRLKGIKVGRVWKYRTDDVIEKFNLGL